MSGTLFYLIGASGSGKDSILAGCRRRLPKCLRCCVAHRYITRDTALGGENHIHLDEAEFAMRKELGLFAMHWSAHGYHYGIGSEIENWLKSGANVLINGSRSYLPDALQQFPEMVPVLVDVRPELLKARLEKRGRETADEIAQRLLQHQQLLNTIPAGTLTVANEGDLNDAISELLEIVTDHSWLAQPA